MVTKAFGLLIIAVFCGCYMLKSIAQKKQGIKTMQLGKGKAGVSKWIEILLKISSSATFAAQTVSIIAAGNTDMGVRRGFGLIVAAVGTIIFIKSVSDMKDNWRAGTTTQKETELVTNGIYGYSRNPAFLGFDLCYIGLMVAFFNWPLCCIVLITVLLFHLQIVKVEEEFLQKQFGNTYPDYKKSVNRYFGKQAKELKNDRK